MVDYSKLRKKFPGKGPSRSDKARKIKAIAAAGKKIPEDFSVMGFFSGLQELALEPGLTTVHLDFYTVLLKAKELLLNPPAKRQIIPADISLCRKGSIRNREPG